MTDGLGLFDDSRGDLHAEDDPRDSRRPKGGRRKRKPAVVWAVGLLVVGLIGAGVWFGLTQILGIGGFDDYSGAGESDLIVEIKAGQGTADIGGTLKNKDVVASAKAFVSAGDDQPKVKSIQPGFYQLKTKMSGKAAVDRLVTPKEFRVGQLQIRAGTQLDDITLPDKKVTQGVFSLMAKASESTLNGKKVGLSLDELRKAAETADLAALGVPQWAIRDAAKAEPKRRLEGLITPGVYDVQPGWTAEQMLKKVVSDSAATLGSWGMPKLADNTGFTPYQVLVMGSLVEREGIEGDFKKISRVTYRRLAEGIKLGYDSTINYVLDRPSITTEKSVRETPGPYNTYLNTGLTPTPIAATSEKALKAAVTPEEGPWRFFVKCQKDGTSCFAETQAQHEQNIRDARARGAY